MSSERQIHQAFSHFLDSRGIPYVHSRTDRRTTSTLGDCDYYVFWQSRMIGIELKVPGNKLSPAQEKRIAFIRAAGCRVEVAYSLEAAIEAANSILCDHGQPGALKQDVAGTQKGGDVSCATNLSEPNANSASSGVAKSNPEAAPNFTVANVCGTDYVGAKDPTGVWCRIRVATPADIINLRRAMA